MQWAETSVQCLRKCAWRRFPYSAVSETRGYRLLRGAIRFDGAPQTELLFRCRTAATALNRHRGIAEPGGSPLHRMKAEYKQQFTCVRDAMKCKF